MHELAVCQALLAQVDDIARVQNAIAVYEINVDVGPLSGVVPELLTQAFTIARAGTLAHAAELIVNEPRSPSAARSANKKPTPPPTPCAVPRAEIGEPPSFAVMN